MTGRPTRSIRKCRRLSKPTPLIEAGCTAMAEPSVSQAPKPRQERKAKTTWTPEENEAFFRAMAEYMYVDEDGLKPLIIYPSAAELEVIEKWEYSSEENMDDEAIALTIEEDLKDKCKPGRRPDLLFLAMRHLQRSSADPITGEMHSTREVSEKVKNVRGRFVNPFMAMREDGSYPERYAARYVSTLLNNYVSSPFFPAHRIPKSHRAEAVHAVAHATDDISLWIQAMFWLYPENMYLFMHQCAIKIVRTDVINIEPMLRSSDEQKLLVSSESDPSLVVQHLRKITQRLSVKDASKKSKVGSDAKAKPGAALSAEPQWSGSPGKKRGRSKSSPEPAGDLKRARRHNCYAGMSTARPAAIASWEGMKNEDKLGIVGKRVKLIASVGGVIRRDFAKSKIDINYHLYRLYATVSRFSDITQMFLPAAVVQAGQAAAPQFEELVVVRHFDEAFEDGNVEPRIRVSKERFPCTGQQIEPLIRSRLSLEAGDTRKEVPVWLAISKRSDNRCILALIITSARSKPAHPAASPYTKFRSYQDEELSPAIFTAIQSNGQNKISGAPIRCCEGLNFWPLYGGRDTTISLPGKRTELVSDLATAPRTHYAVACAYQVTALDRPWWEPRVLSGVAYECQMELAFYDTASNAPSYNQLAKLEAWTLPAPIHRPEPVVYNVEHASLVSAVSPSPTVCGSNPVLLGGSMSEKGFAGLDSLVPSDELQMCLESEHCAGMAGIANAGGQQHPFSTDYANELWSALGYSDLLPILNAPSGQTHLNF
ncbi:hypothetical protein GQ54DRAFT_297953 [Martensiomyces pterosporus]|nr:hypothetical protein GQ54DRAFT_297953 [Martensiomyces pterosporus]